jgi:predicted secreted protein
MGWVGAIVAYLIIWWTIFFAVLPWGVRGRWESEDDGVVGADPGAPAVPNLKKKALITSGLSAVLLAVVYLAIESGLLGHRD